MANNIPTRVTRQHNKSSVAVGASDRDQYQVELRARQPEYIAATYLGHDDSMLHIRRKKGSGSSKQLEVMIPMADVIELTGNLRAGEAIVARVYNDVLLMRLRHQRRVTKGVDAGFAVFSDAETGEVTRLNLRAPHVTLVITSEDVKATTGAAKKGPVKKAAAAPAKGPVKKNVRREA